MKVLITGVSGFIGQHLSQRLVAADHEVHGLYEHPESRSKNPELSGRQHVVDLTDHATINEMIADVQPDAVLHLASRSEVALSFSNYIPVTEVNYLAVVNLAEACRRYVSGFRAFIMASTMETYGNAFPITGIRAFTEDTPQYPMAPYAVAKLACERYLQYMGYAYQFPHIVLRQTNTYGRRDNSFFIVERIVSQMLAGDTVNLGVSWPVRNFLWIDDLIDLYQVLIDQLPLGETFVTGPNNALTIEALVNLIAERIGWDGTVNWGTVPVREAEVPYLNSDPAKAKRLLGWEPRVQLEEGLDRTIAIWSNDPTEDRELWAPLA